MRSRENSCLLGIVDVEKYPILENQSEKYEKLLALTREKYQKDGIVILPGFLTEDAIAESVAEVLRAKGEEWMTQSSHNVFLDSGDSKFPPEHIRNRQLPTSVASLAYDKLSRQGSLLSLYNSEPFRLFLSQVLGLDQFYRLEDPLGAASINIFPPGTAHNWHFDEVSCLVCGLFIKLNLIKQSVFSVTIMIQKPEAGGLFRNTRPIRKKGEETADLYQVLEKIVDGTEDIAETLRFEPGTLSIFCGSRCLHEVTKVEGERDRLVAVFCFATRPGVTNSPQVQELFWGRTVQL